MEKLPIYRMPLLGKPFAPVASNVYAGRIPDQLAAQESPSEFVRRLSRHSDIRMPGKDGIELLGLIRSDRRLARIPVVLLTAKGMAQDRVQGYKAGADVYLSKPFDPDELLSIVDNLISRRQQMGGKGGGLMDLKDDIDKIKQIMKRNSATVVKKTDIFLTNMEREVLELLCQGYTNLEIAEERNVGIIRINKVIQQLYTKTETRNRTELVRWAITTGYVSARS